MIELGIQSQRANCQQNESNVRIHDESKNPLFQRHIERPNHLTGQLEGYALSVEALHRLSLHLLKQIFFARCHVRSEEHTSELQSQSNLVCRLLLEKKKSIYWSCLTP